MVPSGFQMIFKGFSDFGKISEFLLTVIRFNACKPTRSQCRPDGPSQSDYFNFIVNWSWLMTLGSVRHSRLIIEDMSLLVFYFIFSPFGETRSIRIKSLREPNSFWAYARDPEQFFTFKGKEGIWENSIQQFSGPPTDRSGVPPVPGASARGGENWKFGSVCRNVRNPSLKSSASCYDINDSFIFFYHLLQSLRKRKTSIFFFFILPSWTPGIVKIVFHNHTQNNVGYIWVKGESFCIRLFNIFVLTAG